MSLGEPFWPKSDHTPSAPTGSTKGRQGLDMADARSSLAFGRAAASFDVHESDYLVLTLDGITTYEAMAFRFPSASDFDEYLRKHLRTRAAYRDPSGTVTGFQRGEIDAWEVFKSSEDVGCLRKLWSLATQVSKRNLERMAGDDGEIKSKITVAMSQELEDKAVNSGMPPPSSDRDRPSLFTLTKVQNNFCPGGAYQHLGWESFVNLECEARLRRAGKLPKDRKELILDDKKLILDTKDEDFPEPPKVHDLLTLKDLLDLRGRAFHMLEVATFQEFEEYNTRMVGLLRASVAAGMRPPTINEARRCDREIMTEILRVVAKGSGTVGAGLKFFARAGEGEGLWRLLNAQPEHLPDQGKEKGFNAEKQQRDRSPLKRKRDGDDEKSTHETPEKARLCMICKKRHEPRCAIPPGWRKEQKEIQKAKAAKAKASDKPWKKSSE